MGAEKIIGLMAFLVAVPGAVWALVNMRIDRRLASRSIYTCRVHRYDPRPILTGYGARGFFAYWPIESDGEIECALRERNHVILVGRPYIGKSRAAVHHVKRAFGKRWTLSPWWILRLLPYALENIPAIRVNRHRRYVLLLDDVDQYLLTDTTGGGSVLQLVQHLQQQARELVVVATVRSTMPEFAELRSSPRLLGKWRQIELRDWPREDGEKLARLLRADMQTWDGTPLSLIQPSPLMKERYRSASEPQKHTLRILKLCARCGLSYLPRDLLLDLCRIPEAGGSPELAVDERVICELDEIGFMGRCDEWAEPYAAYLEMIEDWHATAEMQDAVLNVLMQRRWVRQLAAFGAASAERGQLDTARQIFERAIEWEPENEAYHYRLGVTLARLHEWGAAEASLREAARLQPEWSAAWYRLAGVLHDLGRDEEAATATMRGRLAGSRDSSARYRLGELLRIEGKIDESLEELSESIRMDPESAEAWHAYGRTLRQASRWSEAIEAHERAIELRPDWADPHFGLAEPLRKRGDLDAAERAYRRAIELQPDLADAYTFLSRLLEERGKREEAEAVLRRGLRHCPYEARIHSFLGQLLGSMHKNRESMEEFAAAVELDPSYVEARVGLAGRQRMLRHEESGLLDEAEANNKIAITLDPESAQAHIGLGLCYLNRKMWDRAEGSFREAARLAPQMGAAWFYLGLALRLSGLNAQEALDCLRRAESLGFSRVKVRREVDRLTRVQNGLD